jgi:periplasmic protein TonB
MGTLRNPIINFPVSGLAAIIVTGTLLIFFLNLSKIYVPIIKPDPPQLVDTIYEKTPEPVETIEGKEFTEQPIAIPRKDTAPDIKNPQATIIPIPPGNIDGPDKADIPRYRPGIDVKVPYTQDWFTPDQVERKPRVLRPITPIYPFQATVNGIEGRVVLRFIVDENGEVKNPVVVKAEPEGVFEEAALAAIVKYRFIPATIGNRKVKCIAVLPVGFKIN